MANDLNRCEFIGRLGKDVETRFITDGKAVANFSLAVGSQWKSKSGEKQDQTEWINVVVYDKLAEICAEYLAKGSQVYVSGKMKTRKWQTKEGQDRYTTEIIVDQMQMLGGKREGGEHTEKPTRHDVPEASKPAPAKGGFDNFDDDIPF